MLRHTDFDMKGGNRTFAAVFIEVGSAERLCGNSAECSAEDRFLRSPLSRRKTFNSILLMDCGGCHGDIGDILTFRR